MSCFHNPNSERTMNLSCASERLVFNENFIEAANNSKILFSEGLLDENFSAFKYSKSTEQKTKHAKPLRSRCCETFKNRFREVFKVRKVDYLFCNKEEATSLVGNNFVKDLGDLAVNFVVTNGAESSFVVENGSYAEIKAKNVKAIDSNGAGDIFAGAALNKIIEEESFLNACKFGNYASSKIVQEKSPRLSVDQYKKLKADY